MPPKYKWNYEMQQFLKAASSIASVRKCGAFRSNKVFLLRNGGERSSVGGMIHCNNAWSCTECATRKRFLKREKLFAFMVKALSDGTPLHFMTLTMSHSRSESLEDCLKRFRDAYNYANMSARKRWFGAHAQLNWVTEVTWGAKTGWHVHYHMLIVNGDEERLTQFVGSFEYGKSKRKSGWSRACEQFGGVAVDKGQDLKRIEDMRGIERYLTKVEGLSTELSMAHKRTKRDGRMHPFDILDKAAAEWRRNCGVFDQSWKDAREEASKIDFEDVVDRARYVEDAVEESAYRETGYKWQLLWEEWEQAMRGKFWARFPCLSGKGADESDEDKPDVEVIAMLDAKYWASLSPAEKADIRLAADRGDYFDIMLISRAAGFDVAVGEHAARAWRSFIDRSISRDQFQIDCQIAIWRSYTWLERKERLKDVVATTH